MKPRVCSGTTLIEVVVGLALLGSLLVILLLAASKLEVQKRKAVEKLQSVQVLDNVLQDCFSKGFPMLGVLRPIPGESRWDCSFEIVQTSAIDDPFLVIRVRMHRHGKPESTLSFAEVLVHKDNLERRAW